MGNRLVLREVFLTVRSYFQHTRARRAVVLLCFGTRKSRTKLRALVRSRPTPRGIARPVAVTVSEGVACSRVIFVQTNQYQELNPNFAVCSARQLDTRWAPCNASSWPFFSAPQTHKQWNMLNFVPINRCLKDRKWPFCTADSVPLTCVSCLFSPWGCVPSYPNSSGGFQHTHDASLDHPPACVAYPSLFIKVHRAVR